MGVAVAEAGVAVAESVGVAASVAVGEGVGVSVAGRTVSVDVGVGLTDASITVAVAVAGAVSVESLSLDPQPKSSGSTSHHGRTRNTVAVMAEKTPAARQPIPVTNSQETAQPDSLDGARSDSPALLYRLFTTASPFQPKATRTLYSHRSLALPCSMVCHCMLDGSSAPPRFSGLM